MGYFHVDKGKASIDINESGILPVVDFQGKIAQIGNGFGMDFALAAHTYDGWSAGLVFDNLIGAINWNYGAQMSVSRIDFGAEHMFIFGDNQLQDVDMDTASMDTTYDIDAFSTRLPVNWRMGVVKDFGHVSLQFDYGTTNHIRHLSFGSRLKLNFFWLAGSWKRAQSMNIWSGALAFAFKHFYWDIGISSRSGLSLASTRGLMIGTSLCVGL